MSSINELLSFASEYIQEFYKPFIVSVTISLVGSVIFEFAKNPDTDKGLFLRLIRILFHFIVGSFVLFILMINVLPKDLLNKIFVPKTETAEGIGEDSYSVYGGNWYLEKTIRNRKEFYEDMTMTLYQDGTVQSETSDTIRRGTWKVSSGTIEVRMEQTVFHLVGNGDMLITTGEPRMEFNRDPYLKELEQALRLKVVNACGNKGILVFGYADYDENGTYEAFALIGRQFSDRGELEYWEDASLWFVCEEYAMQCETEGGCYPEECSLLFQDGAYVFTVVEGYGGSGSQSRLWSVENGKPVLIAGGYMATEDISNSIPSTVQYVDDAEGMTQGEGDDWYAFPSYFDYLDDGTGHTWKRYYYHWNGWSMREYGGIEVPVQDLRRLDGGLEVLEQAESRGYHAWQAFYRGNDIVNVNMYHANEYGNEYHYLTFRWNGGKLILLDTDLNATDSIDTALEYSEGYYLAAHTPQVADYPSGVPWKL